MCGLFFFFSSRRRHTRCSRDWSSDVCSSDLTGVIAADPKQSKISGKVGSAVLPGSDEIWNAKTKKWDKFPAVLPALFMAFRSEERRVGKECRSRWGPHRVMKNKRKIKRHNRR